MSFWFCKSTTVLSKASTRSVESGAGSIASSASTSLLAERLPLTAYSANPFPLLAFLPVGFHVDTRVVREVDEAGTVRIHDVDFIVAIALAVEDNLRTVT